VLTKLTSVGENMWPLWTPDGERIAFHSYRGGAQGIYWKRADGSAEAELLVAREIPGEIIDLYTWTPDGMRLIYGLGQVGQWPQIWVKSMDGEGEPEPFGTGEASTCCADVSPDGRWLAYVTGGLEGGDWQVFVQPYPAGGEKHQISTDGGVKPVWSPDGKRIYYRNGDRIMAVAMDTSGTFRAEAPSVLFEGQFAEATYWTHPNFDLAPDGKSFVMIKADENWGRTTEVRVVQNWFEEVERLAPTSGN
jgi:Tol biopolymer transport system component